jgi:GNAT superfamily N-acetyltransferase
MISVKLSTLQHILDYRNLYLQELQAQSRFHAYHQRGWTDSYLITLESREIGYVSVKGKDNIEDRDTVFELFIETSFRKLSGTIYASIIQNTSSRIVECQTNDPMTSPMLFECTHSISADTILFKEGGHTPVNRTGVVFREKKSSDLIFKHLMEPEGEYILTVEDQVVATGGYLSHYNNPYSDLYMEVHPDHQQRGYGSFLIQELIRVCRHHGRAPAARCSIKNHASCATLLKGGMEVAGYVLSGTIILE